jgi:hypothetical protein
MHCKIFIRTFPSTEECDLFESILQTRWPDLIKTVPGVTFNAYRNKKSPNISTVIWEFPNVEAQAKIEQMIDDNIHRFTKTLSPKTLSFSGDRTIHLES